MASLRQRNQAHKEVTGEDLYPYFAREKALKESQPPRKKKRKWEKIKGKTVFVGGIAAAREGMRGRDK